MARAALVHAQKLAQEALLICALMTSENPTSDELILLREVISTLQSTISTLQASVSALESSLKESQKENSLLRQKLDALARPLFGKKSEQLDSKQLMLLLSGSGETIVEVPQSPARQLLLLSLRKESQAKTQRIRVPENLEVVSEVIQPEIVQAEPGQWKQISQEVSRLLDYQPGKFFWKETIRPKYVRVDQKLLPSVIAPAPARVADGIMAAPGLLGHVLVSKFADHIPFYRLQMMFWQRQGVFIARAQMVIWTRHCVLLLEAIVLCIKKEAQASGYVQVDETPVRYMDPENPGRCSQGYLWTALIPKKCVLYEWHASRAAACLDSLLGKDYAGKIQCDGYSANRAFARDKEIILIGCMAHLRRGFFEARDQAPGVAGWILNQIGILYGWEEQLRQSRAGPALREARRSSHSRLVMDRLSRALPKLQQGICPKARWAKRSATPSTNGKRSRASWILAKWKSTITWSRTRSGPPVSERKTGSSSGPKKPGRATRPCSHSSKTAGCTTSIPTPTSRTSWRNCQRRPISELPN